MKNNRKGFTLIELLAVIVILAILITVAVPAVTQYLNTARKGTFVTNAQSAMSAVRTDVISNGVTSDSFYKVTTDTVGGVSINSLLESGKALNKSTYDKSFMPTSFIQVKFVDGVASYSICLVDAAGNGIIAVDGDGNPIQTASTDNSVSETTLTEASVVTGKGNAIVCNPDPNATERTITE